MNPAKGLGSLVLVAVASMAFASGASADRFKSTEDPYTKSIVASASAFEMIGPSVTLTCGFSSFGGNVKKHSGPFDQDTGGEIYLLSVSSCNYPTTIVNFGSYDVDDQGSGNGDFQLFNTRITIHGPFGVNCIYEASSSGTKVGSLTGSSTGHAKIDWDGVLPRVGHSAFCGSSGELLAKYTVTTPHFLTVQ